MKYNKWTFEKLQAEALKYKSRLEFAKNSPNAYVAASRKNILDKICSHMEDIYHYWTNEELAEEAKKYKTRSEFQKNSPKAYTAAKKRKISHKICSHMEYLAYPWTDEELEQEALKYKTRKEFEKNSPDAYQAACKRKQILNRICSHMGERLNEKWTDEELAQEALKYNTRSEFAKNSQGAYHTAYKRKILDKICSHMKVVHRSWTNEELAQEALKYDTRSEFAKNSPNAYSVAHRRKILDKICLHMKTSGGSSTQEIELCDIIKSIYPKTHTLRIRSKKTEILVKGKPHIQGFDLDIYIPELRKGIEFDGERWHSFGFMRKDPQKAKWPDEDIKNYHEIKDTFFLSRDIKILHIKGKDWDKDKQACIDKCFAFLK
jgi:hypothetical protein